MIAEFPHGIFQDSGIIVLPEPIRALPQRPHPRGCLSWRQQIFHARFVKEHVNDAMAAFRTLASASRGESGNLGYDIYNGIDAGGSSARTQ
jgi:hypothetical protein